MIEKEGEFLVRNSVSVWLVFFSFGLSAVMMAPSFASVITLVLNLLVLFVLRLVAQLEGEAKKDTWNHD